MGYYIDLASLSLEDYKKKLAAAYLPPSRMILKEWLDERFEQFQRRGIKNVRELLLSLRKKEILAEWSKAECLSVDYLTILLRELNSLLPKATKIAEFPGIAPSAVSALEALGINDTLRLFDRVKTPGERKILAFESGISEAEILELARLTDLSRIKWVGATFARMLYDIGTDSVEKTARADFGELHEKINRLNRERNSYKGHIGLNDMKILVDAARDVPVEMEFE
ncbi:MAG TPA: DUF4332 domain-containing protein [Prolixibacteraceae bacterium]|nr:DUF4332 domain-containing protein [Prolixibacteraceae bacterium]